MNWGPIGSEHKIKIDRPSNSNGEGGERSIGLWKNIYLVTTRLEPRAMPEAVNVEYPAVLDQIELKRRGRREHSKTTNITEHWGLSELRII